MSRYYNPVQDIVEGKVGSLITIHSGSGDVETMWRHYVAEARPGHLYAVIDLGVFKAAECCDPLVDFRHAYDSHMTALGWKFYSLTEAEHSRSA